jgi:lysophospholipase L1-like esterase
MIGRARVSWSWVLGALLAATVFSACADSNGSVRGTGGTSNAGSGGVAAPGVDASGSGGSATGGGSGVDALGSGGSATGGGSGVDASGSGGSATGGTGGDRVVADGGSVDSLADAVREAGGDSNADGAQAFNPCPSNGSPCTVMPIGDSITVGGPVPTNAGYRGPLYNLLKQSGRNVLYLGSSVFGKVTTTTNPLPMDQRHNEGHSSYTINDINNNLDGLNTATFNRFGGVDRDPNGGHWLDGIASGANARQPAFPHIITLMIGSNNGGDAPTTARDQLHALLTKLTTLRPNTQLIVAQIIPGNRTFDVSYNAFVASEVASLQTAGKHVSLVDMYTNFPANGLYTDNAHPNDVGFAFMAKQWFDAIAKLSVAQ